jgi:hypothetical protein
MKFLKEAKKEMKCKRFIITILIIVTILGIFPQNSYAATESNEQIIYNFLTSEMKLNQAAACGVLANIRKESNFNPNASGDRGTSYGICQWHDSKYGSRKQSLINWCKKKGYDYKTLNGQLNYLKYELSANNKNVLYNGKTIYNYLLSVSNNEKGAYNAGYYWCYKYEVPSNKKSASIARGNLAKSTYWPKYDEVAMKETTLEAPEVEVTNTSTGVKISWNQVEGAQKYRIYRNGEVYKSISKASTSNYIDTAVTNGTNYKYYVEAINGSKKAKSSSTQIYYLSCSAIKTISGKKNYIQLQWEKNSKGSGYEICYAKNSNFTNAKTITITSKSTLSKKIANLSKTKYYVKVRVYKTVNKDKYYSEWSTVKKVTL